MLNPKEILAILPHRYPFLLIDRVEEATSSKVVGYKCVSFNEPFFQGHFPENPVMPGVLIIEAMAQLGAFLVLANPDYKDKLAYLVGVDKARFRKPVLPGNKLDMEAELLRFRGSVGKIRAKAMVDGDIVAEAEIMFTLIDKEE